MSDDEKANEMRERLARLEVGLAHLIAQTDRMVLLLDRMVRVEEQTGELRRDIASHDRRITANEKELESWRSARRVMVWVTGVVSIVIGGIILAVTGQGAAK